MGPNILRPFNTFGPRESLPYFIPEMIRQCVKEPVILVGNLETEGIEGEIINIGTNKTRSMQEILSLIRKGTNAEEKEVAVDERCLRPKDVTKLITSNVKARRILGWKPAVDFEDGIHKTINWYVDGGMTWGYEKHGWQWRY